MTDFTQAEITAYYTARVPAMKQPRTRYWRAGCPVHQGRDPNFAVDSLTGLAKCHSRCGKGWDIFSLEMELSSLDFPTAKTKVFRLIGRADPKWEERDFEAVYDYTDEAGKLRYQVVRRYGKKFSQRQPDGTGGWLWGLRGCEWVPFNLPAVAKAERVWIVEGEKDALTLGRFGLVGTCNNGGAGHFKPELARWFTGKHVAILPDNDEPGRDHALKVAALLSGKAASVKIVELVGLPPKGDVTDFVTAGGEAAALEEAYARATAWTPDWEFHSEIPSESDKYIRTFEQAIDESGGMDKFWNLLDQEGMETPFERLTRQLGGLRNGEVYVIGADQGAGKTSLALQFIIHAMRQKAGVLMFSMEMSWRDVFQRLASIQARVDLQEYREFLRQKRDGPLLKEMRMRLATATSDLCQYTLFVSNKTGVTPDHLLSESMRLKKRKPIQLVVVDHMQLMSTTGNVKGDYEKFTAISRACKETAMQMKVPLILVSQTSRNHTSDKRSELEVYDLRGSGAIEEDAAGVLLLYADKQDRDLAKQDGIRLTTGPVQTWLKVGKNRFGQQGGYLKLAHQKKYTRFDEYTAEVSHVA